MNPDTTLMLVGINGETVHKVKQLGLHVLPLQHPSKISGEQEQLAGHTRVLDHTDWAAVRPVAEVLHSSPGFGATFSLAGPGDTVRELEDYRDRLEPVTVTGFDALTQDMGVAA